MSAIRRFAPFAALSLVALVAVMTAGCGKNFDAGCAEKCQSAPDLEACISSYDAAEATAAARGCESEFEAYAACADAHPTTCYRGILGTGIACEAESHALTACAN